MIEALERLLSKKDQPKIVSRFRASYTGISLAQLRNSNYPDNCFWSYAFFLEGSKARNYLIECENALDENISNKDCCRVNLQQYLTTGNNTNTKQLPIGEISNLIVVAERLVEAIKPLGEPLWDIKADSRLHSHPSVTYFLSEDTRNHPPIVHLTKSQTADLVERFLDAIPKRQKREPSATAHFWGLTKEQLLSCNFPPETYPATFYNLTTQTSTPLTEL